MRLHMPEYIKLAGKELDSLVGIGELTAEKVEEIRAASAAREPGTHAENVVRVPLNSTGSIWVQSIHFYGGEHFGKPHHFDAEISHTTTNSHFQQWCNRTGNRYAFRDKPRFTY